MVARCANPNCTREFRELGKGRLFLLPPVPEFGESLFSPQPKLIDHCYWLCPECSLTHTVSRERGKLIVTKLGADKPRVVGHAPSGYGSGRRAKAQSVGG